jgi:hypothetical protein
VLGFFFWYCQKPNLKAQSSKYVETLIAKTTQTLIRNAKAHTLRVSFQKPKLKPQGSIYTKTLIPETKFKLQQHTLKS